MPLVSYDSSSESGTETPSSSMPVTQVKVAPASPPREKKRKRGLPKLPSAFSNTNPNDNPAQHQGRTRSRPFVEGDYNAHIYLSLPLPIALRCVIADITSEARKLCPEYTIHSLVSSSSSANTESEEGVPTPITRSIDLPLHISLTHPLPLRASQLIDFRDEVKTALRQACDSSSQPPKTIQQKTLRLSLSADVVGFANGKRSGGEGNGGRGFLALRVAAGSNEIERLVTQALHPILAKLHLPLYHTNPQFHASFAWTLLDKMSTDESGAEAKGGDLDEAQVSSDQNTTTPFTTSVLGELSEKFGQALIKSQPVGGWEIDHLDLKIGKDIHIMHL